MSKFFTDHEAIAKLILVGLIVQLLVIGYVFWSSYDGRRGLIEAQRSGCVRSKLDRASNARGWRSAEEARRASGDYDVAKRYARIAHGLEKRARINCVQAFPSTSLFP